MMASGGSSPLYAARLVSKKRSKVGRSNEEFLLEQILKTSLSRSSKGEAVICKVECREK